MYICRIVPLKGEGWMSKSICIHTFAYLLPSYNFKNRVVCLRKAALFGYRKIVMFPYFNLVTK